MFLGSAQSKGVPRSCHVMAGPFADCSTANMDTDTPSNLSSVNCQHLDSAVHPRFSHSLCDVARVLRKEFCYLSWLPTRTMQQARSMSLTAETETTENQEQHYLD